jgi:hypothetical protein
MGAGVSADQLRGKTRDELLSKAYDYLDRYEEEKVRLGDLMCMADELTPAEIENTRNDFVKIDRNELGYIIKEDYVEYYLNQLADVDDDEFRLFISAVLSSSHWPEKQLERANCVTMGNEQAKADAEKELLEKMLEQQRLEDAMKIERARKGSLKRVLMIAKGEGSMIDWEPFVKKKTEYKGGRFKARMMAIGHFGKIHGQQKVASGWGRR